MKNLVSAVLPVLCLSVASCAQTAGFRKAAGQEDAKAGITHELWAAHGLIPKNDAQPPHKAPEQGNVPTRK